jgi:predicted glycogen debranching enzyme
MGTVAGLLTRRYHGLLIAALRPPLGRTLLLTKLDEGVVYNHQYSPLYTNRWAHGVQEPDGYRHLQAFRLEGTTPVWEYAFADALLEKRVWMQPGANTTYVQYRLRRAAFGPVTLELRTLLNYRDYHSTTMAGDLDMRLEPVADGLKVVAHETAVPYYLLCPQASLETAADWHEDFFLSVEDYRGQNDVVDDNYYAGIFRLELKAGQQATFVASLAPQPNLDGEAAYAERQTYEARLLDQARPYWPGFSGEMGAATAQLILAADQFIVQRAAPQDPDGRSVIAGYPWFSDWGRDTMISLPGLTLTAGRAPLASQILRTYAHYVDQGMLPNRFPDEGETPEYNTADATLWYFEAARAVVAETGDMTLLRDLFPVLADIIAWHQKGTRYNIKVDPADGLLYAGEEGWQLTWMDAKVGDWVVTPRMGKPVEINALWYNALASWLTLPESWRTTKDERPMTNLRRWSLVVRRCLRRPLSTTNWPIKPSKAFSASGCRTRDIAPTFWTGRRGMTTACAPINSWPFPCPIVRCRPRSKKGWWTCAPIICWRARDCAASARRTPTMSAIMAAIPASETAPTIKGRPGAGCLAHL